MGCLSCAELETKICELADELASDNCSIVTKEGDTEIDRTPLIEAKQAALETYRTLYVEKKCGDIGDFAEMVSTACTTQTKCLTDSCRRRAKRFRGTRRY
jgi:hypothetical protein